MMLLLVVIVTNFVLNVALWVSNLVSWQLLADFFKNNNSRTNVDTIR